MSTDKASLLVPKQTEDADLCTETLFLPAQSLTESPYHDLNEGTLHPDSVPCGKRVSDKLRYVCIGNDNNVLDAMEREGCVTGISKIQRLTATPQLPAEDLPSNDVEVQLGEVYETPVCDSKAHDECQEEENDCKSSAAHFIDTVHQHEDAQEDSPGASLLCRANEGPFLLLSQDNELMEESNVSDPNKEDSLDDILELCADGYGPPIDPPYGQQPEDPEEPEFSYRSARDENPGPEAVFDDLLLPQSGSHYGTLEDFSRPPCAEEASDRDQAPEKAAALIKPKKPKQGQRRQPKSDSKQVSRSKGPTTSALGTVVAPPYKRPRPTQAESLPQCAPIPFPSGCKYRIGQMNPILLPFQMSSPSFHPREPKPEEAREQETERDRKEGPEKVIGTLTRKERKEKVRRYIEKRKRRIWEKKVSYACRKRVAERRLRIQGKFVAKDAAAALLGSEAADLSRNGLVQSLLQTNAHCSIISSANNLKIRNVQSLFGTTTTLKSSGVPTQVSSVQGQKPPYYKVVPGTSGNKIAIHTTDAESPSSVASPLLSESLIPESHKFCHIVDLPFVSDPVFLCKRKKLEETPASHLKHHKN